MCVREGKEFEESFPHLGRDGILKSPFNRGRHFKRRRFHFVSFATDGAGKRDEREEIGRKKAEQLLKLLPVRKMRNWESENDSFYDSFASNSGSNSSKIPQ